MDIWEVFQQRGPSDPYVHVGSVLAPDRDVAIVYAKECFFRRMEGRGLWVVRREDVHRLTDPAMLEQVTDKSYRYPEAYRGVVEKREKAHAKYARKDAPKVDSTVAGDEF
ncbi:MAG: phenylacetic acid degradation protein PaaB [Actinobacteria bacterium]|nr:phenylacetic acid degradation protein PaaB [Actinomycetota bacterium]